MKIGNALKLSFIPLAILTFNTFVQPHVAKASTSFGEVIDDINTNEARFNPGQQVTIYVDLTNNTGTDITNGSVTLYFKHFDQQIATSQSQTLNLTAGSSTTLTYTWTPPTTDGQGYSIEAWVRDSAGNILDNLNSAVDVSSSWTKFPRYGFMDEFGSQSSATTYHWMWELKNNYINGIQFYDWQWKHHVPLAGTVASPASSWQNVSNTTNYRQTVLDGINGAHSYNMAAMNYNLMYGAWAGYGQDGSGVNYLWGLWTQNNGTNQWNIAMPSGYATPAIYIFNPGNTSWQNYIYGQESNVFQAYPFDGWQVDQLGNWGTMYDWYGNPVNYEQGFVPFLNNAETALGKTLIFNDVGAFGLSDVAASSSDPILYVECWPDNGQVTYNDLKNVIDQAETDSNGTKPVILAAYMDTNYAKNFTNSNPGYFSDPCVLLTEATIDAAGGDHISLGDNLQMLNTAYYPNHSLIMDSNLQKTMYNYNTFMVAYENLLRGGLQNTSNQVVLNGITTSNNASPNTVWEFTKSGNGYDTIQLINLLGESSNQWQDLNASYPTPTAQSNVQVKYYYGSGTVSSVAWASPDYQNGKSYDLSYTTGSDGGGNYISFTVPSLQYWDMIYISKS